ncbi:MAG: tyrosine-type recombinase/integrase [Candidatus Obscuribacterales bacterium]|nr:tyrosine-type recombinase/integrase [Candidatus Obscuribacterales bacterium]
MLGNANLLEASLARFEKYQKWLQRQPLSAQTRRAYLSRIQGFLGFLGESGEDLRALVANDQERKHVLQDYKRYLKQELKLLPASVNANLTATDHFLQFLGATATKIAREDLPQEAPRAMSKKEQQLFLRAVAACRRNKDRAVALLLFYSGIRISECIQLNVDDVSVIGRKNRVVVRSGKGDKYREIPLHPDARDAIKEWLDERVKKFDENKKFNSKTISEALFLNPQGKRLSTASLDLIVRKIGQSCGLELSAHVLRHSCLTNLVRNGNDLVLVAEIGGHKRLETTKRYTLPTDEAKQKAITGL